MTTNEMSNEELQAWVEKISLESFRVPFRHQATFNRRLSSTGGRYFMKSHHIEINPHQLATHGREEVERSSSMSCAIIICILLAGVSPSRCRFQNCCRPLVEAVSANRCRRARRRAGVNRNRTDTCFAAATAGRNTCVNGRWIRPGIGAESAAGALRF